MKSLYQLYLNAFVIFAKKTLDKSRGFQEMTRYATLLHQKAEHLVKRASRNSHTFTTLLQKEIYETGRQYIRLFSEKFKYKRRNDDYLNERDLISRGKSKSHIY